MILVYFMAAAFCLGTVSCSNDDNDEQLDNSSLSESILSMNAWKSNNLNDMNVWGNDEPEISLTSQYIVLYFIGNKMGIGRQSTKEYDTYFGASSSTVPFSFTYEIQGDIVIINGKKYKYKKDNLISIDGYEKFTKAPKTSDDEKWLESAKYYVLPDDERLNFKIGHACVPFGRVFVTGTKKESVVTFYLLVDATDHVFSRGFTSLSATYKISGGTFSKIPTTTLSIPNDNSCQANSETVVVTTTSQAIVTATISLYDSKNKKNISFGTVSYNIPQDNWQ